MEKFCVFCGNKPKNKNNEHIIPKWLIELTGDSNRMVDFGPLWNSKTQNLEFRKFAFDQFQFPACEDCNIKYSDFETKAKNIIEKLLNEEELNNEDFLTFLDWLDKIRVGLWLGYNYLQKNLSDVYPNYHISKRIGIKDRAIFIYKSDSKQLGINFAGANTPAFQYLPTCFNLRINQFCFFNLSTDFLISKNLGLPYSKEAYYTDSQEIQFVVEGGRNRILYPLIKIAYDKKCSEIYQSIYSHNIKSNIEYLYNNDYTKSISKNFEKGIGKVLIAGNNKIREYPTEPSKSWIPKNIWNLPELIDMIGRQVLNSQIYFINKSAKYNNISLEKRNLIEQQLETAKSVNRMYLKFMNED
ncbi:MAG: hypothetical protein KF758_03830 [Anaerolineales bacterium]|nr:hypothetical protein [Anaerolineales bacterium]